MKLNTKQIKKILEHVYSYAFHYLSIDEEYNCHVSEDKGYITWNEGDGEEVKTCSVDVEKEDFYLVNQFEIEFEYMGEKRRLSMTYMPVEYVKLLELLNA